MSTKCPARSLRTDGRGFLIADAQRFGSELDQVFCPCLADPRSDFSRGCHQGSVSLPCLGLSMFRLNSHTSFCSFNITSIDLNFIPTAHSYPLAKGKLSSGSSRFISSSIDWCRCQQRQATSAYLSNSALPSGLQHVRREKCYNLRLWICTSNA